MAILIGQVVNNLEDGKKFGLERSDITLDKSAVKVTQWYSYPWNYVLRCKDVNVAKKIASDFETVAKNPKIHYSKSDRYGFYVLFKKANGKFEDIGECNTDNAQLLTTLLIANGFNISRFTYCGSMRNQLMSCGWECMTFARFLETDEYLRKGDVLVADGLHCAVVLQDGEKVESYTGINANVPSRTVKSYATCDKNINMREGAGTDYKVLKVIAKGTRIHVCDAVKNLDGTEWAYVAQGGKFGWVRKDLLTQVSNLEANELFDAYIGAAITFSNVFAGAGATFGKIAQLAKDDVVQVIGQKGSYLMIRMEDGKVGFVDSKIIVKK